MFKLFVTGLVAFACSACSFSYVDADGTMHLVGLNVVSLRQDCAQTSGRIIEIDNQTAGAIFAKRTDVYSAAVGLTQEKIVTAVTCGPQDPEIGGVQWRVK
jgi:hypothetical protein